MHTVMCISRYVQVEEEGHYVGCVKYRGQRIGPSKLTIICLNGELYELCLLPLSPSLISLSIVVELVG